jgi:ribonuclease PH
VLCTATVEGSVPPWLRNKGKGWVTAEYGMLPPRHPHARCPRGAKGKQSGRTQEIQRLIGRSLRAVVDLEKLGERQITLDCDVIQADGGTRTAAISGAWVALRIAVDKLMAAKLIESDPIRQKVAAVSCGIHNGAAVLDLDYPRIPRPERTAISCSPRTATSSRRRSPAEGETYDEEGLLRLLRLARIGCTEIFAAQDRATGR